MSRIVAIKLGRGTIRIPGIVAGDVKDLEGAGGGEWEQTFKIMILSC